MMRNKILIAAALVLPLMQACDRSDRSPTASTPSSERQARTPSAQDRMLEGRPPAAGVPSQPGSSSSDMSGPSSTTGGSSTPDSGSPGSSSIPGSPTGPGSTGSTGSSTSTNP